MHAVFTLSELLDLLGERRQVPAEQAAAVRQFLAETRGGLMYSLLRSWLFRLDPERAHAPDAEPGAPGGALCRRWVGSLRRWLRRCRRMPVQAFGLRFSQPGRAGGRL